jgi:hypothetical protein
MTDDEYRRRIDRESVQHERDRPRFPDPAKVRRVRIDDHTLPQRMAHQRLTEDDEMADDSQARRDAYREAQHATTVTGERVQSGDAPRQGIHEDLPPDPTHDTAQVGHPHNYAPEAA